MHFLNKSKIQNPNTNLIFSKSDLHKKPIVPQTKGHTANRIYRFWFWTQLFRGTMASDPAPLIAEEKIAKKVVYCNKKYLPIIKVN
jgi:hypothetical protein